MSTGNNLLHLSLLKLDQSDMLTNTWEQIVQYNRNIEPKTYNNVQDIPSDTAELLVGLGVKINKNDIDRLKNLKYIGIYGTGYGGIDVAYAESKSIIFTNISNYSTNAVAEFTFSVLLEKLRSIEKAKQQAATGDYSDHLSGFEIHGKNFSVIGLGNIGYATAKIAHGFGAKVHYWDRNDKSTRTGQEYVYQPNLKDLVAKADFISLNLALNNQTEEIISKDVIESIKPGAILINVSPMELIEFEPLLKRLRCGDISLIIDHADEMTRKDIDQIKNLINVTIYPPIAYKTSAASKAKGKILISNMESYMGR